MTLRLLAVALLAVGSAAPYTAPVLCVLFQSQHVETMEKCPEHTAPVTGAGRTGCDLAQCATAAIAVPMIPLGLSLARAIVELEPIPFDNSFDGDPQPPLTPPPIA